MITTLAKTKIRLGIASTDVTQDPLLTQLIQTVGARFDCETGRTLARTVGFVQEFNAELMDVAFDCYPVDTVTKFETRTSASAAWVEATGVEYLVRRGCILTFFTPLGASPARARVTYTGGYVMPDAVPEAGQTALPAELEAAALEQIAQSFQLRTSAGVYRVENTGGTYWELGAREWVLWVRTILRRYRRLVV